MLVKLSKKAYACFVFHPVHTVELSMQYVRSASAFSK